MALLVVQQAKEVKKNLELITALRFRGNLAVDIDTRKTSLRSPSSSLVSRKALQMERRNETTGSRQAVHLCDGGVVAQGLERRHLG